jgi:hypothetical protein
MRPRTIFFSALLVLLALAIPNTALAQYGYQGTGHSDNPNGPTVSPYLNLLQNNNILGPPSNYQSLVKPLIDQRNAIQRQGNSIQQLQQSSLGSGASSSAGGRATGHPSFFMNYSHYFSRGGGGR